MFSMLLIALWATQPAAAAQSNQGTTSQSVLITLSEEPASRVFARVKAASTLPADEAAAAAKEAAARQAVRVKHQQDRIIDTLTKAPYRASFVYRLDRSTNAVAVQIDIRFLKQLRSLTGVTAAEIISDDVTTPKKRPSGGDLYRN
jgi:hypothetical protein